MDPKPFKLIAPFNLYPDGELSSKVVGIGIGQYPEGGMAVFLIFETGRGLPVSIPLPEHDQKLGKDEFFLKNWLEMRLIARCLDEEGITQPSGKPPVDFDRGIASPIVRLVRNKLVEFSKEERQKYCPVPLTGEC